MKLVPTILLATSLLLVGVTAAPAASATTCAVADPTVETVVCGAYSAAWCVVGNTVPKPDLVGLVTCDFVLLA